jgi:leucyl/phenylalanyl-tRNA--protein transferase
VIFDLDGTPPDIGFPDAALAETEPNGLLAIGGDLSEERVLNAYRHGIFPWYSAGQPILWWSPAPRMVLYPAEFHVSRSLRKSLRSRGYQISVDQAFTAVIRACAAPRDARAETWLVPEMIESYAALHRAGFAHSIEVWRSEKLVGGLYGIALGQMFFGESMFSRQTDASKAAMALLAELALEQPFELIDCQIYTDHLARLGAREIDRALFQQAVGRATRAPAKPLGQLQRRPAGSLRWAT